MASLFESETYSIFNKGSEKMSLLSNVSLHGTLNEKDNEYLSYYIIPK